MSVGPLFALALWLGSALLFWVEPMIGRLFLPALGGAPSVWNTCMVFFQAVLLAGYALASWLSRLRPVPQLGIMGVLGLLGFFVLPAAIPPDALASLPRESTPVWWLIRLLAQTIGLPFLFLSTLAPLLQSWFSLSREEGAKDPYYLYVASNAGSLLALLSYPLLVERFFSLQVQGVHWRRLFLAEVLLVLLCRSVVGRRLNPEPSLPALAFDSKSFARWTALAFVPSSLLLGVTTYLGTDIASIPLLWIIPLALYLLTFILAFARHQFVSPAQLGRALPPVTIGLLFLLLTGATEPAWLLILLHLGFFFLAALLCHTRLAAGRPAPAQLTTFYLAISLGGMLGGLSTASSPPLFFGVSPSIPWRFCAPAWLFPH
jgi:hypothetical protein